MARSWKNLALLLTALWLSACSQTGKRDDELETPTVDVNVSNLRDVVPRCRAEGRGGLSHRVLCSAVVQSTKGDRAIAGIAPGITLDWKDFERLVGAPPQSTRCVRNGDPRRFDCDLELASPDPLLGRVVLARAAPTTTLADVEARVQLPYQALTFGLNPQARVLRETTRTLTRGAAGSAGDTMSALLGLQQLAVPLEKMVVSGLGMKNLGTACAMSYRGREILFLASSRALYRVENGQVTHFAGGRHRHANRPGPLSNPYHLGISYAAALVCDSERGRVIALVGDAFVDTLWWVELGLEGTGTIHALPRELVVHDYLGGVARGPDGKLYVAFHSRESKPESYQGGPGKPWRQLVRIDPATRAIERLATLPDLAPERYQCEVRPEVALKRACEGSMAAVAVRNDGAVAVSDPLDGRIHLWRPGNRTFIHLAGKPLPFRVAGGDGGPATEAAFGLPAGIAFDGAGNLLVLDAHHQVVRRIGTNGIVTTVAGKPGIAFQWPVATQAALDATFRQLYDIVALTQGDYALVSRSEDGLTGLSLYSPAKGTVTLQSDGFSPTVADQTRLDVAPGETAPFLPMLGRIRVSEGSLYVLRLDPGQIHRVERRPDGIFLRDFIGSSQVPMDPDIELANVTVQNAARVSIRSMHDFLFQPDGTVVFTANHSVWERTTDGIVRRLVGSPQSGFRDGPPEHAPTFHTPVGLARSPQGELFVADSANYRIRKLTRQANGWHVSTVAGATTASQQLPASGPAAVPIAAPFGVAWFNGALHFTLTASVGADWTSGVYRLDGANLVRVAGGGAKTGSVVDVPARDIALQRLTHLDAEDGRLIVTDFPASHVVALSVRDGVYRATTLFHGGAANDICTTGSVVRSALTSGRSLSDALTNLCPGYIPNAVSYDQCADRDDPHRGLVLTQIYEVFSTLTIVRGPCGAR